MKAGIGCFSPQLFGAFPSSPATTISMPTIRSSYLALSSPQQFTAERAISACQFNWHYHSFSRWTRTYEPYPTAEEVFLRPNTSEPDEGLGNLYLMDFIHAHKRVGRQRLVHYRENYQEDLLAVLDCGLQMEMDVDKPSDTMVIKHTIGFAALMGMGLLLEIDALQTNVSVSLLSIMSRG